MKISEFIDLLEEHIEAYGDKEVYFLTKKFAVPFSYAGVGNCFGDDVFWITCDAEPKIAMDDTGYELSDFRVPQPRPQLKLVQNLIKTSQK